MNHRHKLPAILTGLATAALIGGCAPGPQVEVQTGAPTLTDANVASVVSTVNQGAVEVAELAATKAENAEVRRFAQQIVEDHRAAGDRLGTLLRSQGITPAAASMTRDVEGLNSRTLATLRDYDRGEAFDRTFMDHEVEHHRWVIQTLEGTLIPSTRNRALQDALVDLVGHLREHLNEAQRVRRTL